MGENKPLYIFGKDVREIPCFRNTFLYGISSGFAGGLAVFLFTSKPAVAMHSGFMTYITVGLVYWVQCRMKYVNQLFNTAQLQDIMADESLLRGTEEFDEECLDRQFKDA